jgi:osmoprotectant transport system ATP-binding protein
MPGQKAASAFLFALSVLVRACDSTRRTNSDRLERHFRVRLQMPNDSTYAIQFAGVGFRLPQGRSLLSSLDLAVRTGETFMLVGRSGSGKTTSLKLINRLLTATSGEVRVEGTAVDQWDTVQLRRRIGYAIQDVGLFPHYTVFENVALVPKLERWDGRKIASRVEDVLALVGLPIGEFAGRYPDELSGGQRQRVGLARALAAEPPILLMDEPFGALDPITRAEIQIEFQQLQQKLGKTIVFVTHDVSEALLLGSRIGLMEDGKLRGVYSPKEFLETPDASVKAYVDVFRTRQQMFQS